MLWPYNLHADTLLLIVEDVISAHNLGQEDLHQLSLMPPRPLGGPHHAVAVQAYQSVKPRILDIMSEIVGECVNDSEKRPSALKKVGDQISGQADDQRWRIFVTGHSMGGSKATLCAYELAVCLTLPPQPAHPL